MSDSDITVQVDNPLLEKWRTHATRLKRMHQAAHSLFKGRTDMSLFTSVALSLGVGCLNLTYGIGQPSATTGVSVIGSGYLSLLSGSVSALSNGLEWPNKAERHDNYASQFGEVVRDINTECTLRRVQDAEYASEGDSIRYMSTEMNRLEDNAWNFPGCIEKSYSTSK
jgi:hypothetical protein